MSDSDIVLPQLNSVTNRKLQEGIVTHVVCKTEVRFELSPMDAPDSQAAAIMTRILLGGLLGPLIVVPIGLKWNIRPLIVVPVGLIVGIISGVLAARLGELFSIGLFASGALEALSIVAISAGLVAWRFYRDPERHSLGEEGSIIAPADGRVVYVKSVEDGMLAECEKGGRRYPLRDFVRSDLLQQSGVLLGIAMNLLDVHVNRSPISGTIVAVQLIDGRFASLRRAHAEFLNQRQITIIEQGAVRVAVVQVASRLVRSIVSYAKVGDEVRKGDRIGVIRFGSQVDLYLPSDRKPRISVVEGQQVKAGVTVIADFQESGSQP